LVLFFVQVPSEFQSEAGRNHQPSALKLFPLLLYAVFVFFYFVIEQRLIAGCRLIKKRHYSLSASRQTSVAIPVGTADWIVNSVGYVQGRGRSYVIAILTRGSSTFGDGVQTIDELSTQVWNALRP